jgi:hypothetical protein
VASKKSPRNHKSELDAKKAIRLSDYKHEINPGVCLGIRNREGYSIKWIDFASALLYEKLSDQANNSRKTGALNCLADFLTMIFAQDYFRGDPFFIHFF